MNNLSDFIDPRFDESISKIEKLKWNLFIGKCYNKVAPKILIIGESHYVPKDEDFDDYNNNPDWTRELIVKEGLQEPPWYINSTKRNRLVMEVEKTVIGKEKIPQEIRRKFWDSVSFYNFVQRLLPNIGKRPTFEDLLWGWEVNFEIFRILHPDIMIFCGVESSKHLMLMNKKFQEFEINEIELPVEKIGRTSPKGFNLSHNGDNAILLFIKHPSMGYSWEPWSNLLNEIAKEKILKFRNELLH